MLLHLWTDGDECTHDRVWAIVFPELDRLVTRLHATRTSAFLRHVRGIMRQIVVDHAPAQNETATMSSTRRKELVALDEALLRLATSCAVLARARCQQVTIGQPVL